MEKVLANGYMILLSPTEEDLILKPMLGLDVGDRITSIGGYSKNGKQTSSNRMMKVEPFMTYQGVFKDEKKNEYMVFDMPDDMISGWGDKYPKQKWSILMLIVRIGNYSELLVHNYNKQSILIYKPIFKMYKK